MSMFGKKALVIEYVWLSGKDTHHDIRSKYKTVRCSEAEAAEYEKNPSKLLKDLPEWNFDGSSTGQNIGLDTEILIRPVAIFANPFKDHVAAIALCECFYPDGKPTRDNTRYVARQVFEPNAALDPWYGLEQEYVLMKHGRPIHWPENGFPGPQGPYYCSNGPPAYARNIILEHYNACVTMGLQIAGANAEVMPGQWEYQIGPCKGIESGDHAVMARWAYLRIAEHHGIDVSFEVKPVKGDWNGSGMHTNFSTTETRASNGLAKIEEYIGRLKHTLHKELVFYSPDNNERLSGHHETSRFDQFSYGVGTRHTSVRIPNQVKADGHGYFEDRRPGSNADPYLVTSRLFASSCNLNAQALDNIEPLYRKSWMPTSSPQ